MENREFRDGVVGEEAAAEARRQGIDPDCEAAMADRASGEIIVQLSGKELFKDKRILGGKTGGGIKMAQSNAVKSFSPCLKSLTVWG